MQQAEKHRCHLDGAQADRQLRQQEAEEHPRYRQVRLQEAQGVQVHEEVQVLLLRSELLLLLCSAVLEWRGRSVQKCFTDTSVCYA